MADLLRRRPSGPGRLRELLARPEPLLAPGCYDGLSARLVERAGFEAAYMTGFGTAATLLGRPDIGLLGLTEMAGNARRIVQAIDLPVIADADTGYGNAVNVIHTVQSYEQAGVAGLHIEDQVMPKRCGHMRGKEVVAATEFEGKVAAAVQARADADLVIIARTDARATLGVGEAIDRARRSRDVGADVLFVEALEGVAEIERVAADLAGTPLLFNWAEGGRTPPLPYGRLAELGFAIVIMPISTLLAATVAMEEALRRIRRDGTPLDALELMPTFEQFTDLIGLPEIDELGARFGSRDMDR
jgi:2,3-dimethylmalate lyase